MLAYVQPDSRSNPYHMTSISRFGRRAWRLVLVIALIVPAAVQAQTARAPQTDLPDVTRALAITNARIVQAPGQVIDRGTVVVRNGLIEAVGSRGDIPVDARILEADTLVVYAGSSTDCRIRAYLKHWPRRSRIGFLLPLIRPTIAPASSRIVSLRHIISRQIRRFRTCVVPGLPLRTWFLAAVPFPAKAVSSRSVEVISRRISFNEKPRYFYSSQVPVESTHRTTWRCSRASVSSTARPNSSSRSTPSMGRMREAWSGPSAMKS